MNRALRVLVADDERDTREYLQEMLMRLGHQVLSAQNGQQLLELARVGNPDLIVTDIKMPDMDGLTAAARVNEQREVPTILVSGHHEPDLLARAADQLVLAYLVKPIKQPDVEAALAVTLARFEQYQAIRKEAHDLKQALEERKVIERAKGAIMRRLGVDEQEAFRRMKKLSSEQNRKLIDIAHTVMQAEDVYRQIDRL
jgi:response regulator NasT